MDQLLFVCLFLWKAGQQLLRKMVRVNRLSKPGTRWAVCPSCGLGDNCDQILPVCESSIKCHQFGVLDTRSLFCTGHNSPSLSGQRCGSFCSSSPIRSGLLQSMISACSATNLSKSVQKRLLQNG